MISSPPRQRRGSRHVRIEALELLLEDLVRSWLAYGTEPVDIAWGREERCLVRPGNE